MGANTRIVSAVVVLLLACSTVVAHGGHWGDTKVNPTCSYSPDQAWGRFTFVIDPCSGLEWEPSPGATFYEVWVKGCFWWCDPSDRRSGQGWLLIHTVEQPEVGIPDSLFRDQALWPYGHQRRRYYRVKACNEAGCSRMSRERVWARGF